jgi:hypothetical protein
MPRPLHFAALLALAAAFAPLARASEPVSRDQVMDAIRVFESKAQGHLSAQDAAGDEASAVARACNTILKFSLESDLVVVDLGNDSVPWCDVKKGLGDLPNSGERGLLLAAYLAGSVKAQLESGKQDPNPYKGWVNMLHVYRTMKVREGVTIPEVEGLLAFEMNGTLEAHAAEAVRRSTESLRRLYGTQGGDAKAVSSSPGKS